MKRKTILKTLSAASALMLVAGACFAINTADISVKAETTFEMGTGVSLRIGTDSSDSGMRFYSYMNDATKANADAYGYGFLVFPHSYLGTTTSDYHNKENIKNYVEIAGDKAKIYKNADGDWVAQCALTGILETNFKNDLQYTCVAWVKDSTGAYTYAKVDPTFSRSAYGIASTAYLSSADYREDIINTYTYKTGDTVTTQLGSEAYPIIIDSADDLTLIANEVDNGATFEGVNFKLTQNIELKDGFEPIASTFLGTIQGDGMTVSGNLSATLVEGKTAEDLNVVEAITVPETLVELNEDTWSADTSGWIYNKDVSDTFVDAETMATHNFAGDYTGNAVEWVVDNGNPSWMVKNEYSETQLNALANNYDYVRFYLAMRVVDESNPPLNGADSVADKDWYYSFGTAGLIQYAKETNGSSFSFGPAKLNTWYSFTIPVNDYISYVNGKDAFQYFGYSWCQQNGKNSMQSKVAIYISGLELITEIPVYFAEVKADTVTVYHGDYSETYVSAEEVEMLNFAGDYSGAAYKIPGPGNNTGYFKVINTLTNNQIALLDKYYDYVSFYLAVTDMGGGDGWYFTYGNGLMGTATYKFTVDNVNTWTEVRIPIQDFVTAVTGQTEVSICNRAGSSWWTNASAGYPSRYSINTYITGLKFGVGETNVKTITDAASVIHSDYTENFVTAADMSELISGDYNGNAVKYVGPKNNTGFYKVSMISARQKQELKDGKYEYIRLNIAVAPTSADTQPADGWYYWLCDGILQYAESGLGTHNGSNVFKFTASNISTWIQLDIPAEDFLTFINGKTEIELFKYYYGTKMGTFDLYIGDIEFVKAEA